MTRLAEVIDRERIAVPVDTARARFAGFDPSIQRHARPDLRLPLRQRRERCVPQVRLPGIGRHGAQARGLRQARPAPASA